MRVRSGRLLVGGVAALAVAASLAAVLVGAGIFGSTAEHDHLIDSQVRAWWNQGGAWSYVIAGGVGIVLVVIGVLLAVAALRPPGGPVSPPQVVLPSEAEGQGKTSVRLSSLRSALAEDLEAGPDVQRAKVDLTGRYPALGVRAAVTVSDQADMERLQERLEACLDRFAASIGVRPDPVLVTVRFTSVSAQRSLA